MKIVFVSLASHFTEGMNYQDNAYVNQARIDGHAVSVISDCSKFVNGELKEVKAETTILKNGAKLIRVKYRFVINRFISSKIRSVNSIYNILEVEKPDLIYCHAMEYEALSEIIKFVEKNKVSFLADEHADFNNSARSFFAKVFLYKLFYRRFVRKAIKILPCVFCITPEVSDFVEKIYGVPKSKIRLMPLGGTLLKDEEYKVARFSERQKLGFCDEDLVFAHSGKISKSKKTIEILSAFHSTSNPKYRMLLIGTIDSNVKPEIEKIIDSDPRILFLGWTNGSELNKILCASDVYVQIGSQSATLQDAVCCRNAVIVFPHKTYTSLFGDSAFYSSTENELVALLSSLTLGAIINKRKCLYNIAKNQLDYSKQLATVYSYCQNLTKK
jgi:hypothetical protein